MTVYPPMNVTDNQADVGQTTRKTIGLYAGTQRWPPSAPCQDPGCVYSKNRKLCQAEHHLHEQLGALRLADKDDSLLLTQLILGLMQSP